MTVALTAPISETEYRALPQTLKIPEDITGDSVTNLLNEAWSHITAWCNKPLSKTASTDVYGFKSKYANIQPDGNLHIAPRYTPLISVTSVSWSTNIGKNGWTASANYDAIVTGNKVVVYDTPFVRSDFGYIQLVYYSGYDPVPDVLKMLCALITSHLFSGSMFPSQGGGSILPSWLPTEMKEVILRHRRVI